MPGPKFHELRHTFVALWVAAGADPKEVPVRTGHSSVAFTLDRYGHLHHDTEDDTRSASMLSCSHSLARISRGPIAAPPPGLRSLVTTTSSSDLRFYWRQLVAPTGFEPVLPP